MYEYRRLTPEQRRALVAERLARGFPPHSPPHFRVDRATYLLTAACYEHACHMTDGGRRGELLDELFDRAIDAAVEIDAWVILPNHYHLLAHVETFDVLKNVFGRAHGATARAWNVADATPGRKVWYRYSDRAMRSERHYWTTLNYIHFNPVRHGWAASPYEWKESSVGWYLAHCGREWLRETWVRYPLRSYGDGWDVE